MRKSLALCLGMIVGSAYAMDSRVEQLFEAIEASNSCVVKRLLIDPGVDILARDQRGVSVLEYAERMMLARQAECPADVSYCSSERGNTRAAEYIVKLLRPVVHSIMKARRFYEDRELAGAVGLCVPQRQTMPDDTHPGTPEGCAICLGPLDRALAETPCGHCFHTLCLIDWGRRGNVLCPICRQRLVFGGGAIPMPSDG